jgi:hypothetical protein
MFLEDLNLAAGSRKQQAGHDSRRSAAGDHEIEI